MQFLNLVSVHVVTITVLEDCCNYSSLLCICRLPPQKGAFSGPNMFSTCINMYKRCYLSKKFSPQKVAFLDLVCAYKPFSSTNKNALRLKIKVSISGYNLIN